MWWANTFYSWQSQIQNNKHIFCNSYYCDGTRTAFKMKKKKQRENIFSLQRRCKTNSNRFCNICLMLINSVLLVFPNLSVLFFASSWTLGCDWINRLNTLFQKLCANCCSFLQFIFIFIIYYSTWYAADHNFRTQIEKILWKTYNKWVRN